MADEDTTTPEETPEEAPGEAEVEEDTDAPEDAEVEEPAAEVEAEVEVEEGPEVSPIVKLHHLKPAPGSRKRKIRVGRGEGGRRGKTAGRGMKGQKARGNTRLGFEGGQMPLQRRVPKLKGFKNPFRVEYNVINLDVLEGFDAGTEVSPEFLKDRGLVHVKGLVKILGDGEITKALTVKANAFSRSAAEKIRAAGGTTEVVK